MDRDYCFIANILYSSQDAKWRHHCYYLSSHYYYLSNGPSLIPGTMMSLLLLIRRSGFDSRNDTTVITHSTVIVPYSKVTAPE